MSLRRYPDLGRHLARWGLAATLLICLGCFRGSTSERPPIHPNPNMDRQPKALAQSESDFFYDGGTMRLPVEGTVARGDLRDDTALYYGKLESGDWITANPLELDGGVLRRGAERFGIYCQPCHGANGNGRGVLYARAKVQCADLGQERLVEMPDGQLFDTITHGVGLMPAMKSRIPREDIWAIIAHVRELQAP